MLDFLRKCVGYVTGQETPRLSVPDAHIWSVDEKSVDFLVGEDAIKSVPRDQLRQSPFAQQYALEGTVVVDIRPRRDNAKHEE